MRNRGFAPWRTRRRAYRLFDLTQTHNHKQRQEPRHEQAEDNRGVRRSRIRWGGNGATGRTRVRQHRPPSPSSSAWLAYATTASTAAASLGCAATAASAATPTAAETMVTV